MLAARIETFMLRHAGFNTCVAARDLRMRLRGLRPYLIMLVYATAIGATAIIPWILTNHYNYRTRAQVMSSYATDLTRDQSALISGIGRTSFIALAHCQLALLVLILPAYAAGAIAMEREKRTLEMLRATTLSATDVVTGKLLPIIALGLLLMLTSLPVAAWCMLLGGVSPMELAEAYAIMLATVVFVSALGMALSSGIQRPIGAILATYICIIALYVMPLPALAGNPSNAFTFAAAGSAWGMGPCTATAFMASICGILLALFSLFATGVVTHRARALGQRPAYALARQATLIVAILLLAIGGICVPWLARQSLELVVIGHPHVVLSCVLSDFAHPLRLTAASMAALGLLSVGLWMLSVHSYDARN